MFYNFSYTAHIAHTPLPGELRREIPKRHRLALERNEVEARDIKTAARIKSVGNTIIQPPGYKFPARVV